MKPAERDTMAREVQRLADASPFELWELRIGMDRSVHVILDRRDGRRLAVDEAARFNHHLRRELSAAGFDVDSWSIEIESPGVTRPLRNARHFAKSVGERIRVVRRDPAAPQRVVTGMLRDVGENGFRMDPEGGSTPLEIRFDDVSEARRDPKLPF
jgi:ribosome maturation factor RimP